MLEKNFTRLVIRDILSSQEYTLEGISRYADIHEDVLQDIFIGQNTNPSASFLRKIIGLHRSIRIELYNALMAKIASKILMAA